MASSPITIASLTSISMIDWTKASDPMQAILRTGRAALDDFLMRMRDEQEAREVEALRADLQTISRVTDLEWLDDYLDELVMILANDLMALTSPELAAVVEETGGRTISRMRRGLATELLKSRLQ